MACEELARLFLKRRQSARCCNDLAEVESRLFAELWHWKDSFRWFGFLLLSGTGESGALKANALPGGQRRLAVRAVKGAQFAFIGAKRETLDRRSGRFRRRFLSKEGQEGQHSVDILIYWLDMSNTVSRDTQTMRVLVLENILVCRRGEK